MRIQHQSGLGYPTKLQPSQTHLPPSITHEAQSFMEPWSINPASSNVVAAWKGSRIAFDITAPARNCLRFLHRAHLFDCSGQRRNPGLALRNPAPSKVPTVVRHAGTLRPSTTLPVHKTRQPTLADVQLHQKIARPAASTFTWHCRSPYLAPSCPFTWVFTC